jgi:hypothetical protein
MFTGGFYDRPRGLFADFENEHPCPRDGGGRPSHIEDGPPSGDGLRPFFPADPYHLIPIPVASEETEPGSGFHPSILSPEGEDLC